MARQIEVGRNQSGRFNVLESYYHDFIKVEAHTQNRGKITRLLSEHAVEKDFTQRIGIRGMSDKNIIK